MTAEDQSLNERRQNIIKSYDDIIAGIEKVLADDDPNGRVEVLEAALGSLVPLLKNLSSTDLALYDRAMAVINDRESALNEIEALRG